MQFSASTASSQPRGKRIAIVQSCYIPWKGHFDLVNLADELVLLDDVQYTRRDWRNRNLVKAPTGVHWLTIPIENKGRYHQRVCDARIAEAGWTQRHWRTLRGLYAKAPCFGELAGFFEELYLGCREELLSQVNLRFLRAVCSLLEIDTTISWSMGHPTADDPSRRLARICLDLGATSYLSGPRAKAYLDEAIFLDSGIAVEWMSYEGYPEYPQLFPPFRHRVSILDLLFNTGRDATRYMRTFAP